MNELNSITGIHFPNLFHLPWGDYNITNKRTQYPQERMAKKEQASVKRHGRHARVARRVQGRCKKASQTLCVHVFLRSVEMMPPPPPGAPKEAYIDTGIGELEFKLEGEAGCGGLTTGGGVGTGGGGDEICDDERPGSGVEIPE